MRLNSKYISVILSLGLLLFCGLLADSWYKMKEELLFSQWQVEALKAQQGQYSLSMIIDKTCFNQFNSSGKIHMMLEKVNK
jgi:hypothetical protein